MSQMTTTTQATFRPRARLLSLLGEQLISDQAVGLIELVKNSYDADATHVDVELTNLSNPEQTRIILRDNGIGMTRDDIEQKWLSPAVDHKEQQKKKKQLTPQQQAELAVMAQVVPVLQQGIGVLTNEQAGMADRVRVAEQLEAIAAQAEAGESAGSP
jgi:hypothetical protein